MSIGPEFEWDPDKADANLRKHGVSFGEAATAFSDPLGLDMLDEDDPDGEPRFLCMGRSYLDRLIVVAYVERGKAIRIISARLATPTERRAYGRSDRS